MAHVHAAGPEPMITSFSAMRPFRRTNILRNYREDRQPTHDRVSSSLSPLGERRAELAAARERAGVRGKRGSSAALNRGRSESRKLPPHPNPLPQGGEGTGDIARVTSLISPPPHPSPATSS